MMKSDNSQPIALKWYICCFNGYNSDNILKIAQDLSIDFGVDNVFCPIHLEKKFNKKTQSYSYKEVPRYENYIFVKIIDIDKAISLINKKYARYYFVNGASTSVYAEVSESEIADMRSTQQVIKHSMFRAGDMVSINSGPFKNFTGIIKDADDETKTANINVEVFDKPVVVPLTYDQFDIA